MKRLLFAILIICSLTISAFAQTPAPTQTQTFSAQEKEAARKKLGELGQVFGVTSEKSPEKLVDSKTAAPASTPDKTMADVADKALNMVGDAVGTISGIIQKVAPDVWEIMVRQQYATAIGMLIGPFLFLIIIGIYTVIVKKYWKKSATYDTDEYFDDDPTEKGWRAAATSLLPGVLALLTSLYFVWNLKTAVPMLINPKYYAVQDLMKMLLK